MSESFGLYYINSGDVLMSSLILVDRATNEDAVPGMHQSVMFTNSKAFHF